MLSRMAVRSYEDEQLALLRPLYEGRFDLWYVRHVVGRFTTWHAKPAGAPVATISAGSPEELVRLIADAETGE